LGILFFIRLKSAPTLYERICRPTLSVLHSAHAKDWHCRWICWRPPWQSNARPDCRI
jgi:hypothetical protein